MRTPLGKLFDGTGDGVGVAQQLVTATYVLGRRVPTARPVSLVVHLVFGGTMTACKIKGSVAEPGAAPADLETLAMSDGLPPTAEHSYADPGGNHAVDDVIKVDNAWGSGDLIVQVKATGVAMTAADVAQVLGFVEA